MLQKLNEARASGDAMADFAPAFHGELSRDGALLPPFPVAQ